MGSTLRQWTALELAVHHQWGGPQSAERAEGLVKEIVDLFVEGDDVWKDDVELLLEEYMEVNFNTICEDDSLGIKFCDMWKECIVGKTNMVSAELGKEYQRHEMVNRSEGLDTGDADDGSDDGEMNEGAEEAIQEAVAQALSAGGEGMEIESESESLKQKNLPPIRDPDGWETVARGKKIANKKK